MNKILFLDVDGCLSPGRFIQFDLDKLSHLRLLLKDNGISTVLSSGRSQPYMEAIAQMLDSTMPYICENGACVFDPETGSNVFETESSELQEYKAVLVSLSLGTVQFEPGKEHTLSFRVIKNGILLPPGEVVTLVESIASPPKSLHLTSSNSAIDVVPVGVNKATAAEFLAQSWKQSLDDMFAFGDSNNDIELLSSVGHPGAPANATKEVKEIASYISLKDDVAGVIDYVESYLIR